MAASAGLGGRRSPRRMIDTPLHDGYELKNRPKKEYEYWAQRPTQSNIGPKYRSDWEIFLMNLRKYKLVAKIVKTISYPSFQKVAANLNGGCRRHFKIGWGISTPKNIKTMLNFKLLPYQN
jgi:hypothetical protein